MRGSSLFSKQDPDVLVLEPRGGGARVAVAVLVALFGLSFLLAGLVHVTSRGGPPSEAPPQGGPPDIGALVAMGVFGAVTLLLGAGLVVGRKTVSVDRRSGQLASWWGTGITLGRIKWPISAFDRVTLEVERGGGRNSPTTYPVRLAGPAVAKPIELTSPEDLLLARRCAEELAGFLKLPLHDLTAEAIVIREPEHLDESVRERTRRTGERTVIPTPPAILKTRVKDRGAELTLELPGGGFGFSFWIQLVVPVVLLLVAVKLFAGGTLVLGSGVALVVGVMFILPFLGALLAVGRTTRLGVRVVASAALLSVEERFVIRRRVVEIPGEEIELLEVVGLGRPRLASPGEVPRPELEAVLATQRLPDGRPFPSWANAILQVINRRSILVRSDTVEVRFGEGLLEDEVRYLHALLRRVVTGM